MKFGVRECCDVVLRAKAAQKIGNKIFYKNEPVCYFDTLKTSTLEGAATTVYAQGGRGNARLMSWDGERTVTFTMEDALISPIGLAILTGAGLIEATDEKPIIQHITEYVAKPDDQNQVTGAFEDHYQLELEHAPHWVNSEKGNIYVMGLDSHGEVITEPYLFVPVDTTGNATEKKYRLKATSIAANDLSEGKILIGDDHGTYYTIGVNGPVAVSNNANYDSTETYYIIEEYSVNESKLIALANSTLDYYIDGKVVQYCARSNVNMDTDFAGIDKFVVDYYRAVKNGAFQVDITPDKFGGAFYLEASTLWRDQGTGQDLPAEFIIPNCRVQSNFTFTMASSGDPSSFTFTMDAFPDYTRYDNDEKVLARIQVIGATDEGIADIYRTETKSKDKDHIMFGGAKEKGGEGTETNPFTTVTNS